LRTT
jgi:hypothetical protein